MRPPPTPPPRADALAAGAGLVLQGGWPLTLARVLSVAGLLSLGGALFFRRVIAPRALERMDQHDAALVGSALARGVWLSLVASGLGLVIWAVEETAQMAGANSAGAIWGALWPVLAYTSFGHVIALQALLLAATAGLLKTGLAVVPALACVAAEAAHGHGMAMGGVFGPLFQLDLIHVLAASIWIGGLLPLLVVVRLAPPRAGAAAARWFSPIGKWALGLLVAAALLQAAWLVGSLRALTGTAYGWMVLAKATLFCALLGFALLNRYRLAPQLAGADAARARRQLVASIGLQTAVGLLTVCAACVLSGLPPGLDRP